MKYLFCILSITVLLTVEGSAANALFTENSPYLQQHMNNPVNWYPWGKEVLEKAKAQKKLIFLSIGYSTCHWCHEMEKESFSDAEVAKQLNKDYIAIKVDREEYPQLDKKYQRLYMAKYGKRGGWPLTVFLSPEGKVFHIATYIPKEKGYGSTGLLNMLPAFVSLQKDTQAFVQAVKEYEVLEKQSRRLLPLEQKELTTLMQKAVDEVMQTFDHVHGGFGFRPKYPEASKIAMLLLIAQITGNKEADRMANETLRKMAQSGLYDQVEGGFFRYTTDEAWQQPHFEKMLYTNAELIPLYVACYLRSKEAFCKHVAEETIANMRERLGREGVFFTASDADSEGEEGGYYTYDYMKIKEALHHEGWKPEVIEENLAYFGIEEDGNVDGELSHTHLDTVTVPSQAARFKAYLKALRTNRRFPFVDEKVITAWNAMMIKALFSAGKIDAVYTKLGEESLEMLLKMMRKGDRLYHQTRWGRIPEQEALLEDYAFLSDALIEGYERTYNETYLTLAGSLVQEALRKFRKDGVWYLSADGIGTVADFDDRYYTSPLSVMLDVLLKLAVLQERREYAGIVEQTIMRFGGILHSSPSKTPKLLGDYLRLKRGDIVIHAKRSALLLGQKAINAVSYPFILSRAQENTGYLACEIGQCFARESDLGVLLEKIMQSKSIKGVYRWQK
jgi:uncharacterized protein YyaL (SSP411 family)